MFGWKLLTERLPARDMLVARRIIFYLNSPRYPLCFDHDHEESINHLFFRVIVPTLYGPKFRGGAVSITVNNNRCRLIIFALAHCLSVAYKKCCRCKYLVLMVVTWCIWLHRNNTLLTGDVFDQWVVVSHV